MKFTLALTTLAIAASFVESFSVTSVLKHVFKRGADDSKCQRAGRFEFVNKNSDRVPPCWIQKDNVFHCYEYKSGNTCDNWDGMFDITKGKPDAPAPDSGSGPVPAPASSCNHGNLGTLCHIANEKCPPCWVKNGNKYDCYAKAQGKCPFENMIVIS